MNKIKISEETKEKIAKFFMRTSIPRLIEQKRKEAEQELSEGVKHHEKC